MLGKAESEERRDDESPTTPELSIFPMDEKLSWADTVDYVLKKKLRVWCWVPEGRWELGKIQSFSGESAEILISNGKVLTVSPEILLPANPNILDGSDDLIQLSYLNEPSVLYNLQYRYDRDLIYTKAGPVLVALNPFRPVQIYGKDFISAYREKLTDDPHVYAIADAAFNEMMRDGVSQSIIISGESGAGKTETAKIAMQYLSCFGGANGSEFEILKTNLILEAFGNAKTSRNSNSSRFGKLIEIHFSSIGKICGAKIQTFLLEKSRVIQRASGERSFHVFYQFCAGAPSELKDKLIIKEAKDYEYLKKSGCLRIEGIDDAKQFKILMDALNTIEISKEDQMKVFSVLASVLWLGNITFSIIDSENHVEVDSNEGLANVAKLLGCKITDLMVALSTHKIRAGNKFIIQKLTLPQAIDNRDALAKAIYLGLFDWIVEKINKFLEIEKYRTGRSISILDIYGFESSHKNGFEQFCINYANERLQQHFNRHLFKLEQEEYIEDGIDWTNIDFVDNTDCLNLFEKKPLGLFSLLDEESTFSSSTDLTFANKLKQNLNGHSCFNGERGGAFRISHFAGEVVYDTTGFLERNRDLLHSECINLLLSCENELPKLFASSMINGVQKQSVATKFKAQLFRLMQRLENTRPHFIRCIKPSARQKPGIFDHELVLQQLRCCGVIEIVQISRSGYLTRMTHQHFAERYGFLLLGLASSHEPLNISVAILKQFNIPPEIYRVGYTKLFFRTDQVARLEDSRSKALQGILWAQKMFRGLWVRRNFQVLKTGATALQSFVRGERARAKFEFSIVRWRAAIKIQKYVRRRIARNKFNGRQKDIVILQSVIRGWLARKQFVDLKKNNRMLKLDHLMHKSDLNNNIPKNEFEETDEAGPPPHQQEESELVTELKARVLKAESALREREEENGVLKRQMREYEQRWADYEAKMKSMEETWQRQLTSLQMSLAAAKKTLVATGDVAAVPHPGNRNTSPVIHPHYDSDDTASAGTRTPDSTPPPPLAVQTENPNSGGPHGAIVHLAKEFEQRRQAFDQGAGRFAPPAISGAGDGANAGMNPEAELRQLKDRFNTWKREYKVRLREAKSAVHKLGNNKEERHHYKIRWWGGGTKRNNTKCM